MSDTNIIDYRVSDIQAAIDAGKLIGTIAQVPNLPQEFVVVPNNCMVVSTESVIGKFLPNPRRAKATVSLLTLESFIAYVNEFKGPGTKVFATVPSSNPPVVTAIIDYHQASGPAEWCDHRVTYAPPFSLEWQRWMKSDKQKMEQVEFATFLEENQELVIDPAGAELLEMAQTLEGHNDIRCNSLSRLNNGRIQLAYEEDVSLRGTTTTKAGALDFPSQIVAAIAPFDGGPAYKIRNRLKYRIPNRKITLWYETVDTHLVIRDVVKDIVSKITAGTTFVPLLGNAITNQ